MSISLLGVLALLVGCQNEKTVEGMCDDMALTLLHDKQDVTSSFVMSCQSTLTALKTQGGEPYIIASQCLESIKSAEDIGCTSFIERTPEMLCDRLAKTLWRNNQKLNEKGFSKCTAMLASFKASGDDRFERSISCIEDAKTVEDLDCILQMSEE